MILKRLMFLVIGFALFPLLFFYYSDNRGLVDLIGVDPAKQEVFYWIIKVVDIAIRFFAVMVSALIGVAFWKRAINPRLTFKEACAETLEFLGQKQD